MSLLKLSPQQLARMQGELKQLRNVKEYQRVVALLAIHEGRAVSEVARMLGLTRQCIYYWLSNRTANGEEINLKDSPRSGRPSLLTEEAEAFVAGMLERSPADRGYEAGHWTLPLLQKELSLRSNLRMSDGTLRRLLLKLGYTWKDKRWIRQSAQTDSPAPATICFQGALICGADNTVKRIYPAAAPAV